MGDHCAPTIGQKTHEQTLKAHGAFSPHETLRYDRTVPPGPTWEGIYLDDRLVMQRLPIKDVLDTSSKHRDVQLVERGEEAYRETVGLEDAPEKRVRFQGSFTAWGKHVQGRLGYAAAPEGRRSGLIQVLSQCVAARRADRKTLDRVTATCVHPLTHRRELFCTLGDTFTFIRSLPYGISASEMDAWRLSVCHRCYAFA